MTCPFCSGRVIRLLMGYSFNQEPYCKLDMSVAVIKSLAMTEVTKIMGVTAIVCHFISYITRGCG